MTTVPVSIQYKKDVTAKDRQDLKNILTQTFNAIAPVLRAHQVVLGELSPAGQSYSATIPEHNIDSLAKTLKAKNFEIRRNPPEQVV